MKKRVCLVFTNEFYLKLINIQSDRISKTSKALSLSRLVEDLATEGIKSDNK